MSTRLTLADAYKLARERGGKCLLTLYINCRIPLDWECTKGHQWSAPFYRIRNKMSWCPHCKRHSSRLPYKYLTLKDAKLEAHNRNGKCLSTEYINSKSNLVWICHKNHQWLAPLNSIRNHGHWYRKCNHNNINIAKEIACSRNGECLSLDYIDNKTPLQWKCDKGHIWGANLNKVKDCNNWCPTCSGRNRTIVDMQNLARIKNGKCLSDKYYDAHTKLEWQCEKEHKWMTKPTCILKGYWCPFCSKYKRENLYREIVSKYLGPPSRNRRPHFLKTTEYPKGLELDIPYYEYRFAIEVQGKQHEKYSKFFHGGDPNKFIKQQERDQVKKDLCEKNQITLIEVWYFEDPYIVIPQRLQKLGLIP
ncbi:hypothetical protein C1646_678514 [Rhizophagus diaphanus]|nr:hypothetical protein C1646_678514 [Rhizophagus diaphanus] [Rhizophagus sp. MUCL 43196]